MALVKRRGQLAAKDELMAEVWAGTVVDENNLAAQISALRKILARDPNLLGCLQTDTGRGYRFVADIEVGAEAGLGAAKPLAQSPGIDVLSLVVLPFINLSSDIEQAYFALGLSQTVATDLSRISGLLVISSASAATFEGKNIDVRHVSRELGVRYVLTGSVQHNDRNLRINARLVDGHSGAQIWSELFDGDDSDLLALQDRITGRIANSIGREIFVAAARDGEARNIDPKSSDLFMRGIAADNKPQSLECLREQEALFARAAELDPKHSDALARLARAILLQATQGHAPSLHKGDMLARGIRAAEKALALDPGNARAHCAMGLVHVLRGDFERSALANETAIALDRNFALAHNNLGNCAGPSRKWHRRVACCGDRAAPGPARSATRRVLDHCGICASAARGNRRGRRVLFARAGGKPKAAAGPGRVRDLARTQGDVPAARLAAAELLNVAPHYRLSQTMDAQPAKLTAAISSVLRRRLDVPARC